MRLSRLVVLAGSTTLLLFAIACSSGGSITFPTAEPAATSTPIPEDTDDGHVGDGGDHADAPAELINRGGELFASVGCSACHGQAGIGSAIAPGLAGHNELQVRRQVRAPIGVMPLFTADVVSSEDLTALVAYVESLTENQAEHGAGHDAGPTTAANSFAHHRMTLTAFEAGNFTEATHHIESLIEILDGQHLALMNEALDLTLAGDFDDAQHMIEEMLLDVLPEGDQSTLATLNLQQALAGLRVGDETAVFRNFDHVLQAPDSPEQAAEVISLRSLVEAEDLRGAEVALSEMLGVESIGVEIHDEDMEGMNDSATAGG